jgi:nucleoside-diphosphate-sugar epimerase
MRVLVTGATGLIGRHTVDVLRHGGHEVRAFQRQPLDAVESVTGDVRTDVQALCAAANDCSAIVHLAGRGDVGQSRRDPLGFADLNATGALNAIEAARRADATFILASSQRVYPPQPGLCHEDAALAPDSPYGYAKWVAELWCRMASEQYRLTTRVLRFFSVYGPGQQPNGGSGVVAIFARAALAGQSLVVQSAGERDFTTAADAARGIGLAVELPADGSHRVYNVATGVGTTFRKLAELVVELTGSRSEVEDRIEDLPGRDLVADIGRAAAELGYTPCVDLRAGLVTYLNWLRAHS